MADTTVAGLTLDLDDDLSTPLGAAVVVKGLDKAGDVCYFIGKTSDVTRTEAVGMLIAASDEYRAGLADLARDPSG
jgi:hypothetical protein